MSRPCLFHPWEMAVKGGMKCKFGNTLAGSKIMPSQRHACDTAFLAFQLSCCVLDLGFHELVGMRMQEGWTTLVCLLLTVHVACSLVEVCGFMGVCFLLSLTLSRKKNVSSFALRPLSFCF